MKFRQKEKKKKGKKKTKSLATMEQQILFPREGI